ncbi:Nn.00g031710.m01.CDS01 [Neocucurbitaria sp. VM-36]
MSGYGKNPQYVYDAEATRSNQIPSYPGVAQPSFASQYTDAPARLAHESSGAEMPYITSSAYESRDAGEHQPESSFIDARPRHPASHTATETEITEPVRPTQGTAGSTVSLQLRTNYDLATNQHTFILMFGSKKCVAALQKVDYDDEWYNYVLNVEVPPFPLTNSWNPTMMLKLQIEDKMGHLRSQTDAGKFTFTDMSPNLAYQSSPDFSRKRKFSAEFSDSQDYSDSTAAKRANTLRFQTKPRSISGAYSTAQISPLPTQSTLSSTYGHPGGYDMPKQSNYASQLSQKGLYAVPSGMNMTQGDYKLPQMSPSLHSYGSYNSLAHTGRSPASISVTPSGSSVLPSPSALAAPVLVRATTLPQAGGTSSTQPFNPYSMYQTKAVLKIDGDLDKMSEEWTQEELDSKRRLVEFKRSQHGSTISTSFAPIAPEARPARSICVSCIWWEEKDECFITSVDTIYLLEQLVNVRFTVEEKNRIRRNLEGFRPLTVSKAKPDSEEFFKVIMGFPNPKPRNIEKDVKVFPWKILSHALKKIISKYSASYSSTAGIGSLPIVSTSSYVPSIMSQAALEAHRNTSPQSVAASTASTAYTPNLTSSSLSPHLKLSAGLDGSAGHSMSVSQRTPSGQNMTQWGPSAHQMSQYPATLAQGGRVSWDYGYLNASATAGVPNVAGSLQMHRGDVTPDISQMPTDNTYQQYGERTTRV